MGIYELGIARESLAQFEPGQCIGLERRADLNFMSVGFAGVVVENAKRFIGVNVIAPFVPSVNFKMALQHIESKSYSTFDNFTVRTPESVVGQMLPYLLALDEAADELLTIKSRLLDPLNQWLGKAISNPGFIEKAWLDSNLKFIDIDKHLEAIAKHYDDKVGDDISFAPLHKVYPRLKDFSDSHAMIQDLSKESALLLGQNIPKVTESISLLVKKLVDANDKEDVMQKAPAATIAKLSDCLYHAGREVEFLSIILFQIKACCVAFDETCTKINNEM